MIYVAGPYYDKDPAVIEKRMDAVYAFLAALTAQGKRAVTPMLMHEVVKRYELPNNYEFWGEYSKELLYQCTELYVLCLPGWTKSGGLADEMEFAKKRNMPIKFFEEDDFITKSE